MALWTVPFEVEAIKSYVLETSPKLNIIRVEVMRNIQSLILGEHKHF